METEKEVLGWDVGETCGKNGCDGVLIDTWACGVPVVTCPKCGRTL